jgi:conjugative relaxase-like TrwC/TraI family protein
LALGVTPLRVGQEAYWLEQIARDRCEYYSGKGESPGWWLGSLADRAGLDGEASEEAVHRLFAGQNPVTGEQRVAPVWRADPRFKLPAAPLQAALRELAAARGVDVGELAAGERPRRDLQAIVTARGKVNVAAVERVCRTVLGRNPEELYGKAYAEARKHAGRRVDARVASFDLSLSDPKSVSLLAAGSSAEVRTEVNEARHAAIREVLGWLEREAVGVRRGHNGTDRFRGQGVTAAAFDHRTSREGDPQWHTHVLVQNATLGPDGRWSALDSKRLYAHAMTADRIYHAALRAELTRRLDVRWRPVDPRSGAAEIDGLHDLKLLKAFSKRRAQVLAQQKEWGHQGIAAGKAAALATRKAKEHTESEETFYQRVTRSLAEHGVGRTELEQVCQGGRVQARELPALERARLLDELAGPTGLTAQASTFARRDVLDALAKRLPVAISGERALAELENLADAFLGSERAVPVTVDRGLEERRYSTPELLVLERGMVKHAERRQTEGAGMVAGKHIRAALQARPGMDADQQAMVRQVTQDGAGISLVVGYAGAGKTYATGAAIDAFYRGGFQVICTAPTGVAARELERETTLPAPTLDALLGQLDRRDERLDRHTVVVLDEAAMVGTRKLARLLNHAERAGSKVVMIGDDRQLAAIDTGGAFRAFRLRLGACELRGNHRQQTALGRDVAALFRAGRQEEAFDRLVEHGKVIVCRTETEANAAQVRDWWQRFRDGQQAGMIAFTRAETTRLNAAARVLMAEDGRLGPDALQVGEREFRIGDQVVCGRNARMRLGVVNGTRGQVTAIDPTRRSLTIKTDDGREVTLPGWYVAGQGFQRPWVDHGYAITGHKTQGLTGDDFSVRPSTRADAHWAYVAASRHRFEVRLYLVEELERGDEDTRHVRDPLEDRVAATLRAMQKPGEQVFAIDQELAAEVRQLSVTELRRERDRLGELLAGAPPSVAQRISLAEERQRQAEERLGQLEQAAQATGGGWGGRAFRMLRPTSRPASDRQPVPVAEEVARVADQAARELVELRRQQQQRAAFLERHQPAAVRYTAVVRELGWHGRATSRALELERPAWLVELLGEPSETSRGQRAWRQTAARLQHYRDAYPNADLDRVVEPEPPRDLAQRRAWRACRQAIDRYQRQHHPRDQRHQRDERGHRDRDWTAARTREQAREREAGLYGSKEATMARHHDHQHDHDEQVSSWPDDDPYCPDEPGVRIRRDHLRGARWLPRAAYQPAGVSVADRLLPWPPARCGVPGRQRLLGRLRHGSVPAVAGCRLAHLAGDPATAPGRCPRRRCRRRSRHHGRGGSGPGPVHRTHRRRSPGVAAAVPPLAGDAGVAAWRRRRAAHRPAAGPPGAARLPGLPRPGRARVGRQR